MLIDKGYYDYDYDQKAAEKHRGRGAAKPRKRTVQELEGIMARFGFATKLRGNEPPPMTAEDMQRIAMEELQKRE